MNQTNADRIVDRIIRDLTDRGGLLHGCFSTGLRRSVGAEVASREQGAAMSKNAVDVETQAEIRKEWAAIVLAKVNR